MARSIKATIELSSCDDCPYYRYIRCHGYDCHHDDAPDVEDCGDEPLAENREGDFPKWCPLKSAQE